MFKLETRIKCIRYGRSHLALSCSPLVSFRFKNTYIKQGMASHFQSLHSNLLPSLSLRTIALRQWGSSGHNLRLSHGICLPDTPALCRPTPSLYFQHNFKNNNNAGSLNVTFETIFMTRSTSSSDATPVLVSLKGDRYRLDALEDVPMVTPRNASWALHGPRNTLSQLPSESKL